MFTSYFMSTLEKKVAIVDVEHNAMLMQVSKLRCGQESEDFGIAGTLCKSSPILNPFYIICGHE